MGSKPISTDTSKTDNDRAPIKKRTSDQSLVDLLRQLRDQKGIVAVTSPQLVAHTGASAMTIKRILGRLRNAGTIVREGKARATCYRLAPEKVRYMPPPLPAPNECTRVSEAVPFWRAHAENLREMLMQPLAARQPVTYMREFVDDYIPNDSSLLPPKLARELAQLGRMRGKQPAGTYARRVLEQLLIDLSWASSHLEGNSYTRLATEALFKNGLSGHDSEAVMLLNHKNAIEFMVDAVPEQGLTLGMVRNLHSVLMQDLLADSDALGTVRRKAANISDTVYLPCRDPALLATMLALIIEKARFIKNPIEAAFFLWVNIAYLQPFEDGNKRTSRLCANIPLMLDNCAPLSFMDVDRHDYAQAMIGAYEFRDVALAVHLFDWTYRRSCKKYAMFLESMAAPDPMRLRYRAFLDAAIGRIVKEGKSINEALKELWLTEERLPGFANLLRDELHRLEVHNCARYRLTMAATSAWIGAGRPY